jgi:hypothetical protein
MPAFRIVNGAGFIEEDRPAMATFFSYGRPARVEPLPVDDGLVRSALGGPPVLADCPLLKKTAGRSDPMAANSVYWKLPEPVSGWDNHVMVNVEGWGSRGYGCDLLYTAWLNAPDVSPDDYYLMHHSYAGWKLKAIGMDFDIATVTQQDLVDAFGNDFLTWTYIGEMQEGYLFEGSGVSHFNNGPEIITQRVAHGRNARRHSSVFGGRTMTFLPEVVYGFVLWPSELHASVYDSQSQHLLTAYCNADYDGLPSDCGAPRLTVYHWPKD